MQINLASMEGRVGVVLLIAMLSLSGSISAGGQKAEEQDESKVTVFVSIMPQRYFVDRIGRDRINSEVLVPPGKSPATYEPSPKQVLSLGAADLFFSIGVPFEQAFLSVLHENLPELTIVDSAAGIERRTMQSGGTDPEHESAEDHDHGHDHESAHDPHVWMDPLRAQQIAENMLKALVAADPAGEDEYKAGYAELTADLDRLHSELAELLKPLEGSLLFVYHPAFGYFAERYGLRQKAIEVGGNEPSAAALEDLIEEAKQKDVRVIFVQPEFSEESARKIAQAIDGSVAVVGTLQYDYIENLRNIVRTLRNSLQ